MTVVLAVGEGGETLPEVACGVGRLLELLAGGSDVGAAAEDPPAATPPPAAVLLWRCGGPGAVRLRWAPLDQVGQLPAACCHCSQRSSGTVVEAPPVSLEGGAGVAGLSGPQTIG